MLCCSLPLQVLLPHYGAVPAAGRKALVDLAAVAGAAGEGEGQQGQAAGAGGSADGVDGAPTSSAQGGCLAIGLAVLAEGAPWGLKGAASPQHMATA